MKKGILVVGPEEMGVKTSWGKPVEFLDSGLHYVGIMPGCGVERYSKEWYMFDFPVIRVYSGEKEIKGVEYKPVPLTVDSVAYVRFPRNEKLLDILRVKIPREESELKDWVGKSIFSTLRVVLGRFCYREIFKNIEEIREEVDDQFKQTIISQVGFERDDLILRIKEIKVPPDLEKMMSKVNEKRLEAEAAKYEAEAKGTKVVGSIIQSMSEAYGIPPEELQKEINASPRVKKLFLETSIELYKRDQAKEGGNLLDLYLHREGKEGNKKSSSIEEILEILSVKLLGSIKREIEGKEKQGEKKEDLSKKKTEDLTDEELEKELEEELKEID